jgi:hypothetical protein
MRWTQTIDAYCERLGPAYWAEPVNALTNLAFLIAALVMWRRTADLPPTGLRMARALCAILAAIGIGSFLFHTHATAWAALADILPIGVFILTYLFATNRDILGLPRLWAFVGTLAFVPYAAALTPVFEALPFLAISSFYWTVPVLILAYALGLRRRHPATARGLALGAGLLVVSLVLRSLDDPLCPHLPTGTHFLWHILNGLMLGWMIEVYRRHLLAAPPPGR